MTELTRDSSFKPVAPVHSHSYAGVEDDANEIFAAAFVQRTAAGRVVIVNDTGGLGVGPIVGVNERNVPDQLGKTYSGPLERPTAKVYQGLFERPIAAVSPVTETDMFETVYAANNHDVCSDSSKPPLGIMVGINTEAGTCTVLIQGGNAALGVSMTLLIDEIINYDDLSAAALTETLNLSTPIPTNAIPFIQRNRLITPFTHATATTAVLEVGNDGDDDAYDAGGDIFTGSAFTGLDWFRGGPGAGIGSPAYDGGSATGQITATITIDAGTVDLFTAGSVRVQLWGFILG